MATPVVAAAVKGSGESLPFNLRPISRLLCSQVFSAKSASNSIQTNPIFIDSPPPSTILRLSRSSFARLANSRLETGHRWSEEAPNPYANGRGTSSPALTPYAVARMSRHPNTGLAARLPKRLCR